MDRVMRNAGNWCNPESPNDDDINQCLAYESELYESSTVDPSHIIHLIRKLIPIVSPGNAAQEWSKPVEGKPLGNNSILQSMCNIVEGRALGKNGSTQAEEAAGNILTEKEKDFGERSGSALEPAKTKTQPVLFPSKENSIVEGSGQENGNHIQEIGDLSRRRVREGGKVEEEKESSPDHFDNSSRDSPVNLSASGVIETGNNGEDSNHVEEFDEVLDGQLENDVQTKVGEEDPGEEAGCVLWDLAATEAHANFMVKNRLLDVLLAVLRVPHSDRMREICLGIFGNLACHAGPVKEIVMVEGLLQTVLQQFFVEDTPSLTEACRLLSAGLHSEVAATWVAAMKPAGVLDRIMWLAANTLNCQLLEKCTELILAMVDSRRDAAYVLLPSLLGLGLPDLLTDLIGSELTSISQGSAMRGDVVLDIVLQIAEALSISEESASQLAASDKLFSLSCQIIRLSARDEIGPSGITATVLIANLLTEEAGLIQQVLNDAILLGRLLALVPSAGDDPGARNALWSILGRICRWLVSTKLEDPGYGMAGMISVLADGCSLLLDDLEVHQEDDVEEDEGGALAGHDPAASTSRGLQAKLATVSNMMRIMTEWTTLHDGNSTGDAQLLRSIRNASNLLKKHIAANDIRSGPVGRDSSDVPQENGGPHAKLPTK